MDIIETIAILVGSLTLSAQHDVQEENQKEEVAITSDEFISTSQEVTRQIEKQKDVANNHLS